MASIQFLWNVLGQRRRVIESLCYAHPDRTRRIKPHSWPITMATVVSGTMWKKFEKRGRPTKAKRRRKADPNTYLKYAGGREHKQNLQSRPREAKRNTFSSLKEFSEQFFFSGIYEIQLRLSTLPSSLWLGPKQSPQKRDTQITNS